MQNECLTFRSFILDNSKSWIKFLILFCFKLWQKNNHKPKNQIKLKSYSNEKSSNRD